MYMFGKLLRSIASRGGDYTFHSASRIADSPHEGAGLYVHIPFCRSMCPYCPYYKVDYDASLVKNFRDALMSEIDLVARKVGKFRFSSLYVGGGTPTLIMNDLGMIIDHVRDKFDLEGYVAVETTPADVTKEKMSLLKRMGVFYISLGVQSFNKIYLDMLGRNYDPSKARRAALSISKSGFINYNMDLIFAFPTETQKDLEADLKAAVECDPDQITCYPLFTFPYSRVGQFKKIKKLEMPALNVRRKMYYQIHDFLEANGYERSSVWSFTRENKSPYSSVTRDNYVGFGPSAATYTGKGFYFNTFSVIDYIRGISQGRPVALKMDVSERMEKIFWLYWRLYETRVPYARYRELFRSDIHRDLGFFLAAIRLMRMSGRENDVGMELNRRGCYWIHLAQNHFALNYVSKIWSVCQSNPWPEKVVL